MRYYKGLIKELKENQVFVFGSNPEGRHGAGTAKIAVDKFGAIYGKGRGLQGQSYALPTKNLTEGYYEANTGITYLNKGYKSLSEKQIKENILELYTLASITPKKEFLIAYTAEGYNLNGYSGKEMAEMFLKQYQIPKNIIFNESFKKIIQPQKKISMPGL